MKIAIIDNYDSFTYNLRHLIASLGVEVDVLRNDRFGLEALDRYDKLVLSPGPGIPCEAGQLMAVIGRYAPTKPLLGVCLGHQAIGEAFGGRLSVLSEVFHGVRTPISLLGDDYLFEGLPRRIDVGRYHSWVVDREGLPDELEVAALSDEGQIMALRHRTLDVRGIQFHPESVLTPDGRTMIENWLKH